MGLKIFGIDTSDPAGLQAAIKAAQPLISEVEKLLATTINRLDGAKIIIPQIEIKIEIPADS